MRRKRLQSADIEDLSFHTLCGWCTCFNRPSSTYCEVL